MFGFFSDFVDSVVDVASSVGSFTVDVVSDVAGVVGDVASSTASFTFDVLGDVATGVGNLAEGTIDLSTDILGALLAPIFDPTYFDPKKEQQREAAERRFERQVNGLRERSNDAVNNYVQQQKQSYQQHVSWGEQTLSKAQKHARYLAFQSLRQERDIVRSYISQLKPRKDALKAQLDNCQDNDQRQQLKAEIRAINALLNPLYTQLKVIKTQFDELHGSTT
jgi:hypothetical protein